jgi:RNA polymerase-binding transcription factor DksA
MLSQDFIKEMQGRLEQERTRIQDELGGLKTHTEVGDDYDENATEVEMDNVSQDLIQRLGDDLRKIEAALARIQDGTYGVDAQGNEIPEQRLRALPWADSNV